MSDFNPETHMIIYLATIKATGEVTGAFLYRTTVTNSDLNWVERIVEKPKKITRWE